VLKLNVAFALNAAPTASDTAADVLAANVGDPVVVPAYIAVKLCVVPAASELVVYTAVPLATATVPSVDVPSRNVMLPVGVPLVALRLAVSVTVAPAATGFGLAVNVSVVDTGAAAFTTSDTTADVLPLNPVVPP
jgi:hypothetical protein